MVYGILFTHITNHLKSAGRGSPWDQSLQPSFHALVFCRASVLYQAFLAQGTSAAKFAMPTMSMFSKTNTRQICTCKNAKHNQPEEPRLPTLPWPTLQENSLQVPLLKKKPGLHSAHSCGFFIIILDFGTFFCLLCFAFPDVFQVLPQNLATSYSSNQTGFQPTP